MFNSGHYFSFKLEFHKHTLCCQHFIAAGKVGLCLDGSLDPFTFFEFEDLKKSAKTFALEIEDEVFESSLKYDEENESMKLLVEEVEF